MNFNTARFFLSRLESLSAAPSSLSFLRFRSKSSKSSEGVQGETVSSVSVFLRSSRRPSSALRDLRPRSSSDVRRNSLRKPAPPATDSPSLASTLGCWWFLVTVCACGGKTLISRLNLLPPPPAAPYGLAPCGICGQFPHLPCRRENRPQTPQAKND